MSSFCLRCPHNFAGYGNAQAASGSPALRRARVLVLALLAVIAALAPPAAARAERAAKTVSVLTEADRAAYARIFKAQAVADWRTADRFIGKLDNTVLLGHVLFQRYMHPGSYRSSFKELAAWLDAYYDHPEAVRLYRLALRRKPEGAAPPKAPLTRRWRFGTRDRTAFEIHNPARSAQARRAARSIERRTRSLLRRERPTQALDLLNEPERRSKLTDVEYDRIRSWIATSYYIERKDQEALDLALAVVKANAAGVPMAHWTAGLAAWRLGQFELSADQFRRLAEAEHVDAWERSAAAYWGARAFLRIGEPRGVLPLLRIAAQAPTSFYGLLARTQLGQPALPPWQSATLDAAGLKRLRRDRGVERAIALAELGRIPDAENELSWAHGRLSEADEPALLALAERLDLPHTQLRVAMSLNSDGAEPGLFPVPGYRPVGGYTVDRALLFAIMRKESKFSADAKSHAGARGLMQLMPSTAHYVSGDRGFLGVGRKRLFDPAQNLALGQLYAARLMSMVEPEGNLLMMLGAYNAGPSNARRWQRSVPYGDDPLLFLESIPLRETRAYVERVMASFWIYRARLGQPTPSLSALAGGAWPVYVALDGRSDETTSLAAASSTR